MIDIEIRPTEIVLDGWAVYVNSANETVAVSSPEKPSDVPPEATRVYVSFADYEAMKLDVLRLST